MSTVDTPCTSAVRAGWGRGARMAAVSCGAKLCAAEAEERRPASVTPIWMVERKRLEFSVRRSTRMAFLSPSSAIFFSLLSLSVMTAISAAAKKPFTDSMRMKHQRRQRQPRGYRRRCRRERRRVGDGRFGAQQARQAV